MSRPTTEARRVSILMCAMLTVLAVLLVPASQVGATDYHVDQSGDDSTGDGSSGSPWRTIRYALDELSAGDTLYIHAGTYPAGGDSTDAYTIPTSGSSGNPITITNYQNDQVVISTAQAGFVLSDKDYITFDGLIIDNTTAASCIDAVGDYITIRNCELINGSNAVKCSDATQYTYLLIEDCVIHDLSSVPVSLGNMDKVVIKGNTMYTGNANIAVGSMTNLVIEDNFCHNTDQRLGPVKLSWGTEGGGTEGAIVRRNVFLDGERYLIGLYSANGVICYNNVVANIAGIPIEDGMVWLRKESGSPSSNSKYNVFKNNIYYHMGSDSKPSYWTNALFNLDAEVAADYGDQEIDYNCYFKNSGTEYIIYGTTWVYESEVANGWYSGQYDNNSIAGSDPAFLMPTTEWGPEGYILEDGSPCIDAGTVLTFTDGSGSGTTITVDDARYFTDGFGLIGGDIILVDDTTAQVTAVNTSNNTITVNPSISWSNNDPVSLEYSGAAPDIGAIETDYDTSNGAPTVDAGFDDEITLPTDSVALDGSVSDDGLPSTPGTVTTTWVKYGGPGTVTFDDVNAVDTTATFSRQGDYVLRLMANDGNKYGSDDVAITVNAPPGGNDWHVDPNGDNGNDGSLEFPWRTLRYGLTQLEAGDTLYVHAGTYPAPGDPNGLYEIAVSGTESNPITIRAYQDDYVRIATAAQGFYIDAEEYIVIDGFEISSSSSKPAIVSYADHITIRNCTIQNHVAAVKSNSTTTRHHNLLVENCYMYDFSDIPIFIDNMDKAIIRNNVLHRANSVLMDPGGVSNLVIEGNFAGNEYSPLGELKVRWGNVESQSGDNCKGAIVRGNVFLNGQKYMLLVASPNGAVFYNNVFGKIDGLSATSGVIYMQQDGTDAPDNGNENNVLKNNIVYHTGPHSRLLYMQDTMSEDYDDQQIDYNCYFKDTGTTQEYIRYGSTSVYENEVNGWRSLYDYNSLVGYDPDMYDPTIEAGYEGFELTIGSPCIDAGTILTRANGSGSGTTITVDDARYFCDGLGMVEGDLIFVDATTARVVSRDITSNTITVDRSISWSDNDPVSLEYAGSAPDIGAIESDYDPNNQPPDVNAGDDDTVDLPGMASLDGTISDDGVPVDPGAVATTWSVVSATGTVTFDDDSAVDTSVQFSAAGTYVLRLTADDGNKKSTDDVTIIATDDGTAYFHEDFDDNELTSNPAWTTLAGSFETFQFLSEPGYEVHALNTNSRMRAGLDDTSLSDVVCLSWDVRHTGGAEGEGGTGNKTGYVWFLDSGGAGLGLRMYLVQYGQGTLALVSTTDSGASEASTLGTYDATPAVMGNDLKAVALVYNRTSGDIECFYEGDSMGTVNVSSTYKDFTRVYLRLKHYYDGWWGQLDIDNIWIYDEDTSNQTPSVDAGADDTIDPSNYATLDGTISDDGLPDPPASLTTTWTKQAGPGTVTFGDSSAVDTTAGFSQEGTYVLRLTADDSEKTDYDEVTIRVKQNSAPTVDAGSNDECTLPSGVTLDGTVSDDGLPASPGSVTTTWSKDSGPGTVTFGDASAVDTTAGFSVEGTYVLKLEADDGTATNSDTVQIVVNPQPSNTAPTADAGSDDSITLPNYATLDGTVSDDGLPSPPASVTTTWTKDSGPGTVTFGDASAVDTTAGFSVEGTYVLKLEADDGTLTDSDTVQIVVNPEPVNTAPTADAGADDECTLPDYATLDGTVSDDGLPSPPASVTTTWSKDSGPGTVTFGDSAAVDTTAGFSAAGTYVLKLEASDGDLSDEDTVQITVNPPQNIAPSVDAGEDGTATLLDAVATESFSGMTLDSALAGQSGSGTGWTGNWYYRAYPSDPNRQLLGAVVVDPSTNLTYDKGGISIDGGDAALQVTCDTLGAATYQKTVSRDLTDSFSGSDLYLRYLVRWSDELGGVWNANEGLGLQVYGTPSSGNRLTACALYGTEDFYVGTWNRLDYYYDWDADANTMAATHMVVVHMYDKDPNGYYWSYDLWVDPNSNEGGSPHVTAVITDTSTDRPLKTADYLYIFEGAHLDTNDQFYVDEIVMGTTWNDVIAATEPAALLDGTVSDDGLPDPPGTLTTTWSKVTGPGTVTFDDAALVDTTVSFSETGVYVLQLEGSDGDLSDSDTVQITVGDEGTGNTAPTADAGSNDSITLPDYATLDGTVSDDGLPDPPASLTTTWTKDSGPGDVTFGDASAVDTTAGFSVEGTYVLKLEADDGTLTDSDTVQIVVSPEPVNTAPTADAGSNDSITLPNYATLDGTISDDGLPDPPASVTTTWSKDSGPGNVTFGDASAVDTTAGFSENGVYVLQLLADDGTLTDSDTVQITVNHLAPTADAGSDDSVTLPNYATLDGTISDDGFPLSPGSVTTTWSKDSGPGNVTFGDASAVDTTAGFSENGVYVLQLEASDGDLSDSDTVQITVNHLAPTADAGSDDECTLPAGVTLDGTISDDGFPLSPGSVTTTWTKSSGPGTVTFGNSAAVDTTAGFSEAGAYILQLEASDGDLSDSDTVAITVNAEAGGTGPFQEEGGTVVMETENYDTSDQRSENNPWSEETSWAGYVGDGYMQAPGGGSKTWATGAELTYEIDFSTAGTYYIWMRRYADSKNENAALVGLDGTQIGGTFDDQQADYDQWIWKEHGTAVYISATQHTFNLRKEEKNYGVDRIILTDDSGYTPSGNGPAESSRQ